MPYKVVLSSTNRAKAAATQKIFQELYDDIEIIPVDVASGVSTTPVTDDEGIRGCINRIRAARKVRPSANAYVGLEGIITKNPFGTFLCGWAVVEADGKHGIGCSAKVELPKVIADKVRSFTELSEVVKEHYRSELVAEMPDIGSNGVITRKLYTRVDEFEDAIRCALGYMINN